MGKNRSQLGQKGKILAQLEQNAAAERKAKRAAQVQEEIAGIRQVLQRYEGEK